MDYTQEIVNTIDKMSGGYSSYEIFSDWIKLSSLMLSNETDLIHGKIWQQRERDFVATMKKYSAEEQGEMSDLFGMLVLTMDHEITDVLGDVYMRGGMGSKSTGQFFTPFQISYLTAQLNIPRDIGPENPLVMNEPSSGGGGMIIAAVRVLKERGVNPQRCMKVVAQDLDWKGVYMTYLQLSILGIKATVVQGDTLTEPYTGKGYPPERVLRTPAEKGVLLW